MWWSRPGMVVSACNPSTQQLRQEDGKFKARLGLIASPCLKKTKREQEQDVMVKGSLKEASSRWKLRGSDSKAHEEPRSSAVLITCTRGRKRRRGAVLSFLCFCLFCFSSSLFLPLLPTRLWMDLKALQSQAGTPGCGCRKPNGSLCFH
jgi:hypothetical protein